MAATVVVTRRDVTRTVWSVFCQVTFDSSYPNTGTYATTGYNITSGSLGVSNLLGMTFIGIASTGAALGYEYQWDNVNNNLHVLELPAESASPQAMADVANATNLSTFVINVKFEGMTG